MSESQMQKMEEMKKSEKESLRQTLIVLVILYAYAMSDKKQWDKAIQKGPVVAIL